MKEKKLFYARNRAEWRDWLTSNFEKEDEIWFVFPSKNSCEEAVSYNDAVEEALCFGWIDSTAGKLDENHGLRRFTPRKDESYYSRPNIERLIWLDRNNMIHPSVKKRVVEIICKPYVFPKEIIDEIKRDSSVWKNYQNFTDSYKRIRVDYIYAAKDRPEEYRKRLENFISKTRENKKIVGFGGIEKYYK